MGQAGDGPTVARLRLGKLLRDRRTAAGITGAEAAAVIHSSGSKISRIEAGLVPVRQRDVSDLLALYGVTGEEERDHLLALSSESARPGWWDQHSQDLPAHLIQILSIEAAATLMVIYDPQAVPALLQTPDYAQAVSSRGLLPPTWRGGLRGDILARRRGRLLEARPRIWALIDEAVLHRPPAGKPAIMSRQVAQLIEDAAAKTVSLQIVPTAVPDALGAAGPFTILRLPGGRDVPDVVLLEQLTTMTTVERLRDVDHYWELFNRIAAHALNPDSSLEYMRAIAQELPDPK